jgi:hypothetical protein
MRLDGRTSDVIDHGIHLVGLAERIEGGEGHANFRGPNRAEERGRGVSQQPLQPPYLIYGCT